MVRWFEFRGERCSSYTKMLMFAVIRHSLAAIIDSP